MLRGAEANSKEEAAGAEDARAQGELRFAERRGGFRNKQRLGQEGVFSTALDPGVGHPWSLDYLASSIESHPHSGPVGKGLLYQTSSGHVCGSFSLAAPPSPQLHPLPPALNGSSTRTQQRSYLLAVDELVVKEKKHPLLALGLWLCNTSQLP